MDPEALKRLEMLDIPDEETESEQKESHNALLKFAEAINEDRLEKIEAKKNRTVYLNKSDIKDEMEIMSTTKKEKLIWIFQTIKNVKEKGGFANNDSVQVAIKEIIKKPFFILKTFEWDMSDLFKHIQEDKDFFRKHNMTSYNPRFEVVIEFLDDSTMIEFSDFTDDFIKAYMEDRLGIKTGDGIDNNQNKKVILQKTKKKQLQLQDLPSNLKWEEITIRFLNNNEAQITARELVYQVSYELMGFQDEKSKKPNFQWNLLKLLSLKNGYLNWDNNRELDIKARDRIKKQKQELLERLKVYFHTVEGDPFFNYREESGYKIKIQLIPEQDSEIGDTIKAISDTVDYYDEDNDVNIEDYFQK